MDQGIEIRPANSEDVDSIYELGIRQPGFEVSQESRFYSAETLRNWISQRDEDVLLVAEKGSSVVGFLFCKVRRQRWASLENIAVAEQHRHQNIAQALLHSCIDRLRELEVHGIHGLVRNGNQAIDFFSKQGFILGHQFTWIEMPLTHE